MTDRLVSAYAARAKLNVVLNPVITALNLPLTPDDLRARLVTMPIASAQAIQVQVVDSDPERAALIANEIARQLVLQSPQTDDETQQTFLRNQLTDLQQKITSGQTQIETLQDQIATMTSAADIADARTRLNTLDEQVNTWQESYAKLVGAAIPARPIK